MAINGLCLHLQWYAGYGRREQRYKQYKQIKNIFEIVYITRVTKWGGDSITECKIRKLDMH